MVDNRTAIQRSNTMRAITSCDTQPEWRIRRALFYAGYRYRKNVKALPGKPDIVFTKRRIAIFVHGCFWHRCPNCFPKKRPKSNVEYWENKTLSNERRDAQTRKKLEDKGWKVVEVFECQTTDKRLPQTLNYLYGIIGNASG